MTLKEAFDIVRALGNEDQSCLRKGVGCMLATQNEDDYYTMRSLSQNGPVNNSKCSNEVGNCGCMHAEIRAVMDIWLDRANPDMVLGTWVMVCTYSPCTNCANFIVEYGPWIKAVYFQILTEHDVRGRDRLQDAGIVCRLNAI